MVLDVCLVDGCSCLLVVVLGQRAPAAAAEAAVSAPAQASVLVRGWPQWYGAAEQCLTGCIRDSRGIAGLLLARPSGCCLEGGLVPT
jgi:hypothetical protein